jgi:hypothetical protein
MSEDQFLILAPKSMVSSLFGGGTSSGVGVGILNNDISLDLGKGPLDVSLKLPSRKVAIFKTEIVSPQDRLDRARRREENKGRFGN